MAQFFPFKSIGTPVSQGKQDMGRNIGFKLHKAAENLCLIAVCLQHEDKVHLPSTT